MANFLDVDLTKDQLQTLIDACHFAKRVCGPTAADEINCVQRILEDHKKLTEEAA